MLRGKLTVERSPPAVATKQGPPRDTEGDFRMTGSYSRAQHAGVLRQRPCCGAARHCVQLDDEMPERIASASSQSRKLLASLLLAWTARRAATPQGPWRAPCFRHCKQP